MRNSWTAFKLRYDLLSWISFMPSTDVIPDRGLKCLYYVSELCAELGADEYLYPSLSLQWQGIGNILDLEASEPFLPNSPSSCGGRWESRGEEKHTCSSLLQLEAGATASWGNASPHPLLSSRCLQVKACDHLAHCANFFPSPASLPVWKLSQKSQLHMLFHLLIT